MEQPNIILTGFMGTGKTTVGKILAQRLGYRFMDTDSMIEKRTGMTVSDMFDHHGEQFFRDQEKQLVKEIAEQQGWVIATGGGLVMQSPNVETLNRCGWILCLTASPDEILDRISRQGNQRPLLNTSSPRNEITRLLEMRNPVYNQFPQFTTSGKTPDMIAEQILKEFRVHFSS